MLKKNDCQEIKGFFSGKEEGVIGYNVIFLHTVPVPLIIYKDTKIKYGGTGTYIFF